MNSLEVLYRLDSTSEISNRKEAIKQACYSKEFGELVLKALVAMTEDERSTLINDIAEDFKKSIIEELESAIDPEMFIEAAVLSRKMRKATVADKLGKKSSSVCAASTNEITYKVTINRQDAINAGASKKLSPYNKTNEFEGACKEILSELHNAAWFDKFEGVLVENGKITKDLMTFTVSDTDKKKLDSFVEEVIKAYIVKFFNKQIGEIVSI